MGLFDRFKRNKKSIASKTRNNALGPICLDGFTEQIPNPKNLLANEWRRKIITPTGQEKFKIKFYGWLHTEYKNIIVGTALGPAKIVASDPSTNQEFLLFDGCKHGYNALLCDTFTKEQIENRPATKYYKDKQGNESFEIIVSIIYGINYDKEFGQNLDANGLIEILDGSKTEFEKLKRDGFDAIRILAINDKKEIFEILSEELS